MAIGVIGCVVAVTVFQRRDSCSEALVAWANACGAGNHEVNLKQFALTKVAASSGRTPEDVASALGASCVLATLGAGAGPPRPDYRARLHSCGDRREVVCLIEKADTSVGMPFMCEDGFVVRAWHLEAQKTPDLPSVASCERCDVFSDSRP